MKVKSLSHVLLFATPWTAAYQAPPSMGFSRQEYWSGVPLPSPSTWCSGGLFTRDAGQKTLTCCSVVKSCLSLCNPMDYARPLCPWGSPGNNTRVGCHFLLQGIFSGQGSNPHFLHWWVDSLPLSHQESPERL